MTDWFAAKNHKPASGICLETHRRARMSNRHYACVQHMTIKFSATLDEVDGKLWH